MILSRKMKTYILVMTIITLLSIVGTIGSMINGETTVASGLTSILVCIAVFFGLPFFIKFLKHKLDTIPEPQKVKQPIKVEEAPLTDVTKQYCPYCGYEFVSDDKKCPCCGAVKRKAVFKT
jgi:hypothetical protein